MSTQDRKFEPLRIGGSSSPCYSRGVAGRAGRLYIS